MRTRVLAACALATLGLGAGVAHASSLPVTSGPVSAAVVQGCSSATITVDESPGGIWSALFGYSAVRLTVPTSCAGAALHVTVYAASGGAALATASATGVPAGSITLGTSAVYGGLLTGNPPYSVALTMDGWAVPAAF